MLFAASVTSGSLPPFAAFAQQKKRADALSVRFLRAALSISRLQRSAAFRPMCQTGMSASGWERSFDGFRTNGGFGLFAGNVWLAFVCAATSAVCRIQ
mgnify:CR=1 FL=1